MQIATGTQRVQLPGEALPRQESGQRVPIGRPFDRFPGLVEFGDVIDRGDYLPLVFITKPAQPDFRIKLSAILSQGPDDAIDPSCGLRDWQRTQHATANAFALRLRRQALQSPCPSAFPSNKRTADWPGRWQCNRAIAIHNQHGGRGGLEDPVQILLGTLEVGYILRDPEPLQEIAVIVMHRHNPALKPTRRVAPGGQRINDFKRFMGLQRLHPALAKRSAVSGSIALRMVAMSGVSLDGGSPASSSQAGSTD